MVIEQNVTGGVGVELHGVHGHWAGLEGGCYTYHTLGHLFFEDILPIVLRLNCYYLFVRSISEPYFYYLLYDVKLIVVFS